MPSLFDLCHLIMLSLLKHLFTAVLLMAVWKSERSSASVFHSINWIAGSLHLSCDRMRVCLCVCVCKTYARKIYIAYSLRLSIIPEKHWNISNHKRIWNIRPPKNTLPSVFNYVYLVLPQLHVQFSLNFSIPFSIWNQQSMLLTEMLNATNMLLRYCQNRGSIPFDMVYIALIFTSLYCKPSATETNNFAPSS